LTSHATRLAAVVAAAFALSQLAAATDASAAGPNPQRSKTASSPSRPQAAPAPLADGYAAREEVRVFMQQMSQQHGFSEDSLARLFGNVRQSDTVLRLIAPAPSGFKRSWTNYRSRFIEPIRIREGVRFWREHEDVIRRASEQFGVPQEIIVSIIGIETLYGRHTGDFRVIDALTTLAFDYTRRAPYFRQELEQFLLLTREQKADPLEPRGSFAGAIGLPQFMPGSIRRFAIDFDGDGTIDLRNSTADAIGSVARFLAEHGWSAGAPTHFPVAIADEARAQAAVQAGLPPSMNSLELAALGVTSQKEIPIGKKLVLVDLPDGDGPTRYVLGANNFYVITRYNRSYFYAMAVIDLADTLKAAR
jgi:membrane-bound lytic murein transglycosylase B